MTSSHGCSGPAARQATAAQAQRRFTFLQLKFNAVITQFDLFADVITQRSENETGVWLSGLDVVSADALALPGYYEAPPVICYLDRDIGAAIRRARTRMPGGGENPVAIIRVPRERMIGTGIASSLVHEVGHQAAALLDLVNSLRPALQGLQRGARQRAPGLAAVGTLDLRDRRRLLVGGAGRHRVHARADGRRQPAARRSCFASTSTIRIRCPGSASSSARDRRGALSASAMARVSPISGSSSTRSTRSSPNGASCWRSCRKACPAFVTLLVNHRPKALRGRSLAEALGVSSRQPARLAALFTAWNRSPVEQCTALRRAWCSP